MTPIEIVDERVQCQVDGCGFRSHSLLEHLHSAHDLSPIDYIAKHPGAETLSATALRAFENRGSKRVAAPVATDLTVNLMGIDVPVDAAVESNVCKDLPEGYMFPTKGKAAAVFKRTVMALARGRNVFLWGMPGTGKDALCHAFSSYTRRPVAELTFKPGVDISPWFYARSIDADGTGWEYGHLWNVLVNGVEGRDGKFRAALVVLSDVDRADTAQAEWFRILCDSMGGRLLDPHGKMVPLFPGTQFVCTANSCGSGDARGRMASANPIDASVLDRLGRKIEAAYMDWEDESKILRGKFPGLSESAPDIFNQLGNATQTLRSAIDKEELYAEFTHRGLVEVLSECQDIVHFDPKVPANLLKQGFRAWLDGLDADSRLVAKRLVDPHLKGGALDGDF